MTTALVTGATGATGKHLVELLLSDPGYEKVIIVHRSPTAFAKRDKITEFVCDLNDINTLDLPCPIDHVFCCLGTTIRKAGSKEKFRQVDFDYVINTARLGRAFNAERFVVISSIGANAESSSFYLRTKGQMEESIAELDYAQISIMRPSILEGSRNEIRIGELLGIAAGKLIGLIPFNCTQQYRPTAIHTLAAAMKQAANTDRPGIHYIRSLDIAAVEEDA